MPVSARTQHFLMCAMLSQVENEVRRLHPVADDGASQSILQAHLCEGDAVILSLTKGSLQFEIITSRVWQTIAEKLLQSHLSGGVAGKPDINNWT